jgi:digeranylgeranylglycerophospholipid reductase
MSGASTLLLDRRREVGVPVVCGELTSGSTFPEFSLDSDGPWVAHQMGITRIVFPEGKILDFHGIKLVTLHRDIFEKHLVEMAMDEGAEIRMNTTVRGVTDPGETSTSTHETNNDLSFGGVVLKNGEQVRAKVIIAADGVKSTIGKSMGMVRAPAIRDLGRAMKYIVRSKNIDQSMGQFFAGEEGTQGYAWILPKGNDTANVGIGTLGGTRTFLRPALDRFIEKRIPGAHKESFTAGCLPVTLPPTRTVWKNVMLVGDAASMVNSVGGAGIRNAMVAGRIAGRIAGEYVQESKPMSYLEKYEKAWRKKLYPRLRMNYFIKELMWHSETSSKHFYPLIAPMNRIMNMVPGLLSWIQNKQHM